MNQIQRARLVGMIFEYGNAVARRAREGDTDAPSADEVEAVAAILEVLDRVTDDEPRTVDIGGAKFEF